MKKKKYLICDIILLISLIFFLGIYFKSFIDSIVGYKECFITCKDTIYGLSAFKSSFIWNSIAFIYIPVIPLVVLYNIIYFIVCKKYNSLNNFSKYIFAINLFLFLLGLSIVLFNGF